MILSLNSWSLPVTKDASIVVVEDRSVRAGSSMRLVRLKPQGPEGP